MRVLSLLHYLIDKTSHYFDTLDMWKSKCVSERELTDMWSIWQMWCACSWSGASISLSFSFFPFCRAVQTHKLNHTSHSHTHLSSMLCESPVLSVCCCVRYSWMVCSISPAFFTLSSKCVHQTEWFVRKWMSASLLVLISPSFTWTAQFIDCHFCICSWQLLEYDGSVSELMTDWILMGHIGGKLESFL